MNRFLKMFVISNQLKLCFCLLFYSHSLISQSILENTLKRNSPKLLNVISNLKEHEVQVLLTQIERDSLGKPIFHEESFNVDESIYFYPASTVKLAISILSLQKIRELNRNGILITAETPFEIRDKNRKIIILEDGSHPNNKLTISHLIKKIFLFSDNDSYNYLFDFLGVDYINSELNKRGLHNTFIYHKFLKNSDNLSTWEYTFLKSNGDILFHQKSILSNSNRNNKHLEGVFKGEAYVKNDNLIEDPMDFSLKNRVSVRDLQGILKRLIFPEVFPESFQFNITKNDYDFIKFWMSRTSLENDDLIYNNINVWDSYNKFFIYGDTKGEMNNNIRIYNKVGSAYGTVTDVSYIHDKKNNIEFFLTATILNNLNGIFNDDIYEDELVGIPFLAELGRSVHELLIKDLNDPINE